MSKETTKDIRDILMKELGDLMSGKVDTNHANSVSKVAGQAIYVTRIELENKRIEVELHLNTDENRLKFIDGDIVNIPKLGF